MDNIASLIRPVLESESKNETLGRLLMSCVDQQAFSKVCVEPALSPRGWIGPFPS